MSDILVPDPVTLLELLLNFTSAGLFSKTGEGTGFHASKSFDSVLCSKSETMIFLSTIKEKDSSNRYGQSSSTPCVLVYLTCPT